MTKPGTIEELEVNITWVIEHIPLEHIMANWKFGMGHINHSYGQNSKEIIFKK